MWRENIFFKKIQKFVECNYMFFRFFRNDLKNRKQKCNRWNGNILGKLHEGSRWDCDIHPQDIIPLPAGGKSCSANPVSASLWVCGSDTRDLSTSVPGSGETNPGVGPASVVTAPSVRHRLVEAHTAPGDSYGQRHEGTAIWRTTSSTEYFFLSSGAVFAETSSSPTTSSTDALISRKRNFSRRQRNGTYKDITSRYVIVVSVYCGGKQPPPSDIPARGLVFR